MVPSLAAQLRHLEITVMRRVEGRLQGDYRGLLPGAGRTTGDARPYVAGDDVRRIDWNVTARTQQPYVRDTEADHELETTLVVDTSASMAFGTALGRKRDAALAVAAAYGFTAGSGGNRVGAVVLGSNPASIPPRSGRAHVYRILGTVAAGDFAGRTDLAGGLWAATRTRSKRGLAVVISDFRDEGPWPRALRVLAHRHDVVAAVISDPRELHLPDVGVIRMEDVETGRQAWVDTASRRMRARFSVEAARHQEQIEHEISKSGAHLLTLSTDRDWIQDVVGWVMSRRRVSAATGRSA